jgi:geranylgeranyl pyrophosphate synthase
MNNYIIKIDKFIKNKYINTYPPELKDKVLYLIQNGKRLRPILFLIFTGETELENNINNTNITYINYKSKTTIIYIVAILIELLHSLSLVLDDLPDMDDDKMRRDNPSFHIKYGIDYTNFFIYYMFNHIGLELDNCNNFIFENIKHKVNKNIKNQKNMELNIKIINDIQYIIKTNINYLIEGQYNDLEWNTIDDTNISNTSDKNDNNIVELHSTLFMNEKDIIFELLNIDNELINYITTIDKINEIELNIDLNIKKTSSLFNLSITAGYILQLWKHNINYLNNIKYNKIYKLLSIFSNILGYMFQLSDDILDSESDLIKNKPNICSILDKDLVNDLLKNGCKWLYDNAKLIHELMVHDTAFEKQDLKNPAHKYSENSNSVEETIDYHDNSDNYSSDGSDDNDDEQLLEKAASKYSANDDDDDDDDSNRNMKNITFNLIVINEIIEKIENRIKKI